MIVNTVKKLLKELTMKYTFHGYLAGWNIPLRCALLFVEVFKSHMLAHHCRRISMNDLSKNDQFVVC